MSLMVYNGQIINTVKVTHVGMKLKCTSVLGVCGTLKVTNTRTLLQIKQMLKPIANKLLVANITGNIGNIYKYFLFLL